MLESIKEALLWLRARQKKYFWHFRETLKGAFQNRGGSIRLRLFLWQNWTIFFSKRPYLDVDWKRLSFLFYWDINIQPFRFILVNDWDQKAMHTKGLCAFSEKKCLFALSRKPKKGAIQAFNDNIGMCLFMGRFSGNNLQKGVILSLRTGMQNAFHFYSRMAFLVLRTRKNKCLFAFSRKKKTRDVFFKKAVFGCWLKNAFQGFF